VAIAAFNRQVECLVGTRVVKDPVIVVAVLFFAGGASRVVRLYSQ